RLCQRIRYRAQVPRNAALSSGADLDQSDSVVRGRTRAGTAAIVLRLRWVRMRAGWDYATGTSELSLADVGSLAALMPIRRDTRMGMLVRCNCATRSWILRSAMVIRVRNRTYSAHDAMTNRSTKRPSSPRSRNTAQLVAPLRRRVASTEWMVRRNAARLSSSIRYSS